MELKIFNSKEDVALEFSDFLSDALKNGKEFHMALSGGSTPKIVFDELARTYRDQILWENVHFYWGDERCVPPGDEQSNYKMTKDHLLSKINMEAVLTEVKVAAAAAGEKYAVKAREFLKLATKIAEEAGGKAGEKVGEQDGGEAGEEAGQAAGEKGRKKGSIGIFLAFVTSKKGC